MNRVAQRGDLMARPNLDGPMKGKTCLVTGATSGIGEVAACELARLGARVIVVGRSTERCAATVERIRTGTGATDVESIVADLSSQAEVRRLADDVRARCDRLDVLLNNAGGMFLDRRESPDGIELTLALNHLSYFLLTNQLLPLLKAGAPARIVNVASDAHRGVEIDFDDLQGRRRYRGWRAYQQSKLANILFTYELARRLEGSGLTANTLHPGFVRTRFFADFTGWPGFVTRLGAALLAIGPEEGARTSVYLASSAEVEGATGQYFVKSRPARSSPQSHDRAAADRLWRVSEELTGQAATVAVPDSV
jgi:NAD(P)-dependent dehydrogenase (short-subunit alcohol dehydrogenase family)